MSFSFRSVASKATTALLVLCAVTVTYVAVRREFRSAGKEDGPPMQPAPQWLSYAAQGRRVGPADAPVALVVFADFECPSCRVFETRLAEARRSIPKAFTVVYRHFPLDIHPLAAAAAEASECAAGQGRFAEMHDSLYQQQNVLRSLGWRAIAASAGVSDLDGFDRCMRDGTTRDVVRRDVAAARQIGASGTPTVLMNGVRFAGVPPQARLEEMIREAIGQQP